jgi:hypothetical protein
MDMDGAALCIEQFAENTLLDIDTVKALNCSESMEKVAWKSYPSCFEWEVQEDYAPYFQEGYAPYFCEDLNEGFEEAYGCFFDLLWEPQCYFDDVPESHGGCAISFARSVGLDVEQVLDCNIDLYAERGDKCYSNENENSLNACEAFERCESVLRGAENCVYNTNIDLSEVVIIVEEALGINDFGLGVYNGTVDLEQVLYALYEYDRYESDGGTSASESEWSEFVECISWEFGLLIDDFCILKFQRDIVGGCVEHFADSFEDLNAEELLTCTVDFWEQLGQKCDYGFDINTVESNVDACETVLQCGNILFDIDYCVGTVFGIGFSDAADIIAGSELSDILSSIYDGTVDLISAFERLDNYDGILSDDSRWEDFVVCIGNIDTTNLNDDDDVAYNMLPIYP